MNKYSMENFFLDLPLFEKTFIKDDNFEEIYNFYKFNGAVNLYCTSCMKITSFKSVVNGIEGINMTYQCIPKKYSYTVREYILSCSMDERKYRFYFLFNEDYFVKIGEYPEALELNNWGKNRYSKILDKDKVNELKLSLMLNSKRLGIGAMTYLRRIYEDLINKAHNQVLELNSGVKLFLDNEKMSIKIEKLGEDNLSEFMYKNKNIYGLLSKGIHELSEEECIKNFRVLYDSIILILEEKIKVIEEEKNSKKNRIELDSLAKKLREWGVED